LLYLLLVNTCKNQFNIHILLFVVFFVMFLLFMFLSYIQVRSIRMYVWRCICSVLILNKNYWQQFQVTYPCILNHLYSYRLIWIRFKFLAYFPPFNLLRFKIHLVFLLYIPIDWDNPVVPVATIQPHIHSNQWYCMYFMFI
jgi:hypothetical protein